MKVRELIIQWGFEVDDKALKSLERDIDGVKSLAKTTAVAIAAIGAAAGFAVVQAGKFEQWNIAFETMLGSAEDAKQLMTDLQKLALKTPFTIPDVIEQSKRLLAYNIAAEEIIPTITALGNIAAGVGLEKLPFLTLALGQVKTKTTLAGQELRQFTEAGVPLLDELSKQLGKTPAQISDMISKGLISFEMVQQAIFDMTSGSGKFSDLMIKQSKSLFGLWSNFKDWITMFAADVGADLLPAAKEWISGIVNYLEEHGEELKTTFIEIAKEAIKYLRFIKDMFLILFHTLQAVSRAVGGLKNALKLLFVIISSIIALKMSYAISSITMNTLKLIKGVKILGNTALLTQAKMMVIPLAIGAALAGLYLIIDDVVGFFQGKKSITGLVVEFFETKMPKSIKIGLKALFPIILAIKGIKAIIDWVTKKETQEKMSKMMNKPAVKGAAALGVDTLAPTVKGQNPLAYLNPMNFFKDAGLVQAAAAPNTINKNNNQKSNAVTTNHVSAPINIKVSGAKGDPEALGKMMETKMPKIIEDIFMGKLKVADASIEDEGE